MVNGKLYEMKFLQFFSDDIFLLQAKEVASKQASKISMFPTLLPQINSTKV